MIPVLIVKLIFKKKKMNGEPWKDPIEVKNPYQKCPKYSIFFFQISLKEPH